MKHLLIGVALIIWTLAHYKLGWDNGIASTCPHPTAKSKGV